MELNNNLIVISALCGIVIFLIYFNFFNKDNKSSKLNKDKLSKAGDNDEIMTEKMKRNLLIDPEIVNIRNDNTEEDKLLKFDTNKEIPIDVEIDETCIYKPVDNSKYEIPVDGSIYKSADNRNPYKKPSSDPRAILECQDKLDCNAKKRYDLLIEDDFYSMNEFNPNCSRKAGTYSQDTNNKDISKDILNEDPNFYASISQHL